MIYPIYQFFKNLIKEVVGESNVQWHNTQFAGVITSGGIVLVEILEANFTQMIKEGQAFNVVVRLRYVTKGMSSQNGTITDSMLEKHEEEAGRVCEAIEGQVYEMNGKKSRKLTPAYYQTLPVSDGWLVTVIDYRVKI
jgi:hypothetical protein